VDLVLSPDLAINSRFIPEEMLLLNESLNSVQDWQKIESSRRGGPGGIFNIQ